MATPKDITGALTHWQGSKPAPKKVSPQQRPLPAQRRLRADLAGGFIYTLLIGALFSQVLFLIAFDVF